MSWGSLEMQTQVPPLLSLPSSDMAESCSSLFVSDTPAILMAKERTWHDKNEKEGVRHKRQDAHE